MISSIVARLVFDDDGVVDADRLRDRNLHAGKKVAQHRPCRKSGDDAGDAGRGKQRDAELPHGVERHQRKSDGDEHDHDLEDPLQYADLGHVLARQQIVREVEPKAPEIKIGADMQRGQRDPAEQANGHQAEQSGENVCRLAGERRRRQRDRERHQQQASRVGPFGRGKDSAEERLGARP